jgi:tetratricopeptide (TPR) repeat protein
MHKPPLSKPIRDFPLDLLLVSIHMQALVVDILSSTVNLSVLSMNKALYSINLFAIYKRKYLHVTQTPCMSDDITGKCVDTLFHSNDFLFTEDALLAKTNDRQFSTAQFLRKSQDMAHRCINNRVVCKNPAGVSQVCLFAAKEYKSIVCQMTNTRKELLFLSGMESNRSHQIREMLASEPLDDFLNYALAIELEKEGQIAQAIEVIEQILTRNENYLGAYYKLGALLEQSGDIPKDQSAYQKGMEISKKQKNTKAFGELSTALSLLED